MPPTPAEIVRTLAAGHLAAFVHAPRHPLPEAIRFAPDSAGDLLILAAYTDPVANALRPGNDADPDADDTAVAIRVDDVPPVDAAPTRGRAWLSGWARPLCGTIARAAAVEFAAVHPTGDLLALGRGFVLHRVEVAEVRLQRGGSLVNVDPASYATAEADPLGPVEGMLLHDLAEHHRGDLAALLHRLAPAGTGRGAIITALRLDRYGMVVELDDPMASETTRPRRLRVDFPVPLDRPEQLGQLLRDTHSHR
jgi:hypothetical protein